MGQMQRNDRRPGMQGINVQRPQPVTQPAPPVPVPMPEPEPQRETAKEAQKEAKKEAQRGSGLLPEGFRLDRDTLLLLALAWLLWQEQADKRLILALIYILL